MLSAVADTHTVIWYIFDDARLSPRARDFFDDAAAAGNQVGVSTITLVEIIYLIEKGRVHPDTLNRLTTELNSSESVLVEMQLDGQVALDLLRVPRADVPDMPDRIIAATALHLGVPVISRDRQIRLSSVKTIW